MSDLVLHVQVCVVAGVCLPHLPDDLDPPLAQAAQGLGVAFAFLSQGVVVGLGPYAVLGALVREEVHRVTQAAVACATDVGLFDFAALKAHGGGACDALQSLCIVVEGAVAADFAQQSWCELRPGTRQ